VDDTRHDARGSTDDVTMRFGPGVPPGLAVKWRQGKSRTSPARRVLGAVITLAIALLTGLVVWWLLRGGGPAIEVTGAKVTAPTGVQHCDATVKVVGAIRTNGGSGDIRYRWKRSDGLTSKVFTDSVNKGQHSLKVPLRWTIQGPGTMHAIATLEIISPKTKANTTSGTFDYACS
jgi:hypothetical protein